MRNILIVFLLFLSSLLYCGCAARDDTITTTTDISSMEESNTQKTANGQLLQNEPAMNKNDQESEMGNEIESFYGEWEVVKMIPTGTVSCYGEEDIEKMIGQQITYAQDLAVWGEDSIKPFYKISNLSDSDFYFGYRTDLKTIGIDSNFVTEVIVYTDENYIDCWGGFGSIFFIKDEDTLIVWELGVFLEMKRIE